MIKKYSVELEGQIEFYEQYLKIINPELTYDDIFRNNNLYLPVLVSTEFFIYKRSIYNKHTKIACRIIYVTRIAFIAINVKFFCCSFLNFVIISFPVYCVHV